MPVVFVIHMKTSSLILCCEPDASACTDSSGSDRRADIDGPLHHKEASDAYGSLR